MQTQGQKNLGLGAAGAAGGFLIGAVYAAITRGPVLLSGGLSAATSVSSFATSLILKEVATRNALSPFKAAVLQCLNIALWNTAFIVSGIALGLIGPVAIALTIAGSAIAVFHLLDIGLGQNLNQQRALYSH